MDKLPKLIIIIGLAIFLLGVIVWIFSKWGVHMGKLPGDFSFKAKSTTLYFPLLTSIIISVILTIIINIILRLFK